VYISVSLKLSVFLISYGEYQPMEIKEVNSNLPPTHATMLPAYCGYMRGGCR